MSLAGLAAWRGYLWPNSDVLKNKLGIREQAALTDAETDLTFQRMREILPEAGFSPDGYRAIHRHIFQDVYDWAGEYRTANMRHPGHAAFFCKTEFIADQMRDVFARFGAAGLTAGETPASFAEKLAGPLGDLNAIHPFREGNGRTMRALIEQYARRVGLMFDQARLDPVQWHEASRLNFITADSEPIRAVLLTALAPA